MTWLTQAAGIGVVPIQTPDGNTIMRWAPKTTAEAWIHPGFKRYTFLDRGVKKGREKAATWLAENRTGDILRAAGLAK